CALAGGGAVACWGDNAKGQLGDRAVERSAAPRVVPGVTGAELVGAGHDFTCAKLRAGGIRCWGNQPPNLVPDPPPPPPRPVLCPRAEIPVYDKPGCGADATFRCVKSFRPCSQQYCGCSGKTVGGCAGTALAPFKQKGHCL
ncbi:MAG: hypothetical protein KIT31_28525, partial [Deltaproteobacteria bacterium]|nr:hypothetical protein [Deltaproteobacteria bacterium]